MHGNSQEPHKTRQTSRIAVRYATESITAHYKNEIRNRCSNLLILVISNLDYVLNNNNS
jgi:hypothetical protein